MLSIKLWFQIASEINFGKRTGQTSENQLNQHFIAKDPERNIKNKIQNLVKF